MLESKAVRRSLIAAGIILMLYVILLFRGEGRYVECDDVGKWFKPKTATYQGEPYRVTVCGDGSGINGASDSIKISVYGPDGDLVAARRFEINFLGSVHPLAYKPEGIEYWDDEEGPVIIPMPPTGVDWIKARIPAISGR